jgi:hypothetical protein
VPDWDSAERRDSDEDAAWRELVASFDAPVVADGERAPWPEREDTARPQDRHSPGGEATAAPEDTAPEDAAPEDGEEHFVPPTPPPLPRLEPLTKAAWAGLFGGPGYLLVGTAAGW